MQGKIKSQYVGLLLIFVMFFSTFAFAIINSVYTPTQPQDTPGPSSQKTVQRYLERALTEQEKTALLQNGVAILEFSHTKNCVQCDEYRTVIRNFYTKYSNVLVLDIAGDKDNVQFTGKETQSVTNITSDGLLDAYCKVSAIQPKECILKNI